jgi:hypothetical protein
MKKAIAAMCIGFAGLCACGRSVRGLVCSEEHASTQPSPQAQSTELTGPDRGVMRIELASPGTGPASAPFAHATAADPGGAQNYYHGKNADTYRVREARPTAIGGGPQRGQ